MNQAQELITCIEIESGKIGLHLTTKKTEVMHYNQINPAPVLAKDVSTVKTVYNFKYFGAWMHSLDKGFLVRKALAW